MKIHPTITIIVIIIIVDAEIFPHVEDATTVNMLDTWLETVGPNWM
jgi:hypothetical protein